MKKKGVRFGFVSTYDATVSLQLGTTLNASDVEQATLWYSKVVHYNARSVQLIPDAANAYPAEPYGYVSLRECLLYMYWLSRKEDAQLAENLKPEIKVEKVAYIPPDFLKNQQEAMGKLADQEGMERFQPPSARTVAQTAQVLNAQIQANHRQPIGLLPRTSLYGTNSGRRSGHNVNGALNGGPSSQSSYHSSQCALPERPSQPGRLRQALGLGSKTSHGSSHANAPRMDTALPVHPRQEQQPKIAYNAKPIPIKKDGPRSNAPMYRRGSGSGPNKIPVTNDELKRFGGQTEFIQVDGEWVPVEIIVVQKNRSR